MDMTSDKVQGNGVLRLPSKPPKVFIVQRSLRRCPVTGMLREVHDYSPAAAYGELRDLLAAEVKPFEPEHFIPELRYKLEGYSGGDFLLMAGNPVLIAISAVIAAQNSGGILKMLQWNGKRREYAVIEANMGGVFRQPAP